jgi:hypothetical protein
MSLKFQRKNDSILCITQKPVINLGDVIDFHTFKTKYEYEEKVHFKNTFTPTNLQQQFLRHCSKTWVVVDEFVFMLVFICISVV